MTPEAVRKFCKALSLVAIVCGAGGMFLCAPFMWSPYSLPITATASLPFIAGSILIGSGLVSFAMLVEK